MTCLGCRRSRLRSIRIGSRIFGRSAIRNRSQTLHPEQSEEIGSGFGEKQNELRHTDYMALALKAVRRRYRVGQSYGWLCHRAQW